MKVEDIKKGIKAALGALEYSYAPYSHYKTAAALITEDFKIYTGCNIENAAFSPTICAERNVIFKAVSEGVKNFRAIVIVGGKDGALSQYVPPCGVCRQVMAEFCSPKTFLVILAKSTEDYKILTLEELLPMSFNQEHLMEP